MKSKSFTKEILPLFEISLFEALVFGILLVAVTLGILTASLNVDGFIDTEFDQFRQTSSAYDQYEIISNKINTNEYVANAVVFTVWAVSGLIMFNVFLLFQSSERSIVRLIHLIRRGGTRSRALLEVRAVQFALRIGAVIGLILVTMIFISVFAPLLVVLLGTGFYENSLDYVFAIIGVWFIASISIHLVIVSLRFLFLRRRLIL